MLALIKIFTSQNRFDHMQSVSKSLPPDIKSAMSGVYDIMHYFDSMPASYSRAFLAVAKDEQKAQRSRPTKLTRSKLAGLWLARRCPESNGSALHDRPVVAVGANVGGADCGDDEVMAVQ
jgi:hypothetical protein